jgi:flagellar hook protein FlgE
VESGEYEAKGQGSATFLVRARSSKRRNGGDELGRLSKTIRCSYSMGNRANIVDIATQFARLILAERDYQANAKSLTTFDDVTQTAINLVQ